MIDLSLDAGDLCSAAEPIRVRARPEREVAGRLLASAVDVETGEELARQPLASGEDGSDEAELAVLPEGVYRVTASGEGPVEPVSDLVTVLAE